MWTAKRVVIYLVALIGLIPVFALAVFFFGDFDGLPPLPVHFFPDEAGRPPQPDDIDLPPPESVRDLRMRQAFGNECEELKRKSLVYLASKGVVLAINKFEIEKDGRVKLTPFSAGLFAKSTGAGRFPEINTVQCEEAFLTMDRPVTSMTELSRSKVVAVELGGDKGVKITNNRKSQEKNDDLELYITSGRLYYEDARNLIWSPGYVRLLDTQSQPLPTQITAVGLEVLLSKDVSPNRDKATPKKADAVSGVEKITLLANVDMHFFIDARSGFLAGADGLSKDRPVAQKAAAEPKKGPAEKAHVHVKTNGKFVYDLVKEQARFDAPEMILLAHDRVIVTRTLKSPQGLPLTDLLDCDRLDLQFVRRAGNTPGSREKDIEFAIATAKPDAIVELHSEGEDMHAFGVEMRYFAPTASSGPRTILKGSPVHAIRQGNQIRCDELHLKGADKQGNGQEAFAKGPGKMDLLDKKSGKTPTHVLFKNSFTMTKDRDGDRVYDLLTLRGEPAFIDEENKQELSAIQFLHVWLEEVKSTPDAGKPGAAPTGGKRHRPHKIEAFDKVQVRSPDLNIRDANHLTVCFREQKITPTAGGTVPALPALGLPGTTATPTSTSPYPDGRPTATLLPPVSKEAEEPRPTEKAKRPLNLTAGEITAYIGVWGNKKELLEFVAEGNVHVTQAGDNPKDKGLDITGNMLSLVRQPRGDILYVFGEPRKLAQLQFNEMLLFGPKVTIDQVENVANVEGTGAMHMPSNTTLDGKKKDGHLTIHWNKSMWFNGRNADFDGGVEAFQDNGKIRCQQMQVTLDQPVHFKQTKGKQSAKIDKILCNGKDDQQVFILEEEREANQAIVTYRRLLLSIVEVDNLEQRLNGSGPGVLDFIGRASAGDNGLMPKEPAKADAANPPKKAESILKWTRVRFNGQMVSYPSSTGKGRQTTFLDQVRVYHQPGEDPNQRDPIAVGKDGLFFTCQRLTIIQRKVGDKNTQEMIADGATGLVNFQAAEFNGNAKTVKYDDAQELIIFEGAPATLFKMSKVPGAAPQRLQGTKILYNRKTGEFLLDGVRVISSWLMPESPPQLTREPVDRRFRVRDGECVGATENPFSLLLARLDSDREDESFAVFRLLTSHDR